MDPARAPHTAYLCTSESRSVRTVPDGNGGSEPIEAWVLLPAQGDGPFPLLVDMHGGPHSIVLTDYTAHTYWYLLLSKGWAIVAPNAVGSASYGRAFSDRLRGRWGELDLPQYQAVITQLQREGIADERLACAGKSYGAPLDKYPDDTRRLRHVLEVAAERAGWGKRKSGGGWGMAQTLTPEFLPAASIHFRIRLAP